jgi:hypothetical protein
MMKKVLRLLVVTTVVGIVGARLIRAFCREKPMKNLRTLFGDEWVEREVLCRAPEHSLGKWYQESAENPVTRYVDELVGVVLEGRTVECDATRLASKLKGEFVETLTELGYAVFLAGQGCHVVMEPMAPAAGPDLLAVKEREYYVEIRKVGLDEAHAAADLATEDIFDRLRNAPSRHSVVISMTEEYSAYSPELKQAVRVVRGTLKELAKRHVAKARLFYHGPDDYRVWEGEEVEPTYDYEDGTKLAAQMRDEEWKKSARFRAYFDDTGRESEHTAVGVLPLGAHPHRVKPDETYLRLRSILRKKKQKQLPKGGSGIILLEITDLAKLMVDDFTLERCLYGDEVMTVRAVPGRDDFPHEIHRVPNGFFLQTSRVSAVVIETAKVETDGVVVNRRVFPTNNPQAVVLKLSELELFGTVPPGLENLCAESL